MTEEGKFFSEILDSIENEDMRRFAERCIETIPDYFWRVGASSTGKYHPTYALGDHGLARHTLALCKIMNHAFSLDCFKEDFTSRERDLLRIAGMMHDTRKSGTQEEFKRSKYTKFNHPELAAKIVYTVWKELGNTGLTKEEINLLCKSIMSHMGQWNTDKRNPGVELPTPKTKYEKLVHFCDYLASRKDIEIKFDNLPDITMKENPEDVNIDEFQIPFGKYKGLTWPEVEKENPGYISWALDNISDGTAIEVLRKYMKEKNK